MSDERTTCQAFQIWANAADRQTVKDFKDACPRNKISQTLLALLRMYLAHDPDTRRRLISGYLPAADAERAALLEARDA